MNKTTFFLFIATIIFFFSCSSSDTSNSTGSNKTTGISKEVTWENYQSDFFDIKYPTNWEVNESGLMGASLILFAPLEGKEDQFRENVNIMKQDLSALNMDLDQFTKLSEEQINTLATNSKILESKRIKEEDHEFHKLVYTADQGVFNLTFEQYFLIVEKEAYILTFTTEQSTFKEYQPIGEEILNSFTLRKERKEKNI